MTESMQVSAVSADQIGDVFDSDCPVRTVLSHVAGRWGVLVLAALEGGPLRFFELNARIGGISDKMLTQTLRTLVRDGLVSRTVQPSSPPKVSYQLTLVGEDLTEPLLQLLDRIRERTADVIAAQQSHDTQAASA
ncbi:winged helix-turn-helix transcriptional regulator [Streptacidiphilus sp. MAP5-3]|uniref:winged helix-turn-helix transcriptional regulator n=1 Tax=unclassified Streptacidiphilus TaxID=2643834 RepID=UPI003516E7E0